MKGWSLPCCLSQSAYDWSCAVFQPPSPLHTHTHRYGAPVPPLSSHTYSSHALTYDRARRVPVWTAKRLTRPQVCSKKANREHSEFKVTTYHPLHSLLLHLPSLTPSQPDPMILPSSPFPHPLTARPYDSSSLHPPFPHPLTGRPYDSSSVCLYQ